MTLGHPRLIGRGRELELLGAAWQQASDGRPRMLVVSGEPGIGKTRLVEEFRARVGLAGPLGDGAGSGGSLMMGDCLPMLDGAVAYAPLVAAMEHPAGDPDAAARVQN